MECNKTQVAGLQVELGLRVDSALSWGGGQLKIITGDHKLVAQYTAEMVGLPILGVITGAEIAVMPGEALLHAARFAEAHYDIREAGIN